MTVTNSVENAERKKREVRGQLPGAGQPADPANCYVVEPGETGAEYWAPDLAGCLAAMGRAAWLSVTEAAPQHVTRRQPGREPKTFRWYRSGREFTPV